MSNNYSIRTKLEPLLRYAYFVFSTGTYCTFDCWTQTGEPNPFLVKRKQRGSTCREDMTEIFADQFKPRSRSQLYGPISRPACPR